MQHEGQVQRVFSKNFNGTTLYSFTLKDQDGFFRTGEAPVSVKEGTTISFEANEKNNVALASVKPLNTPSQTKGMQGSSYSKDDYWKEKAERDLRTQATIQYQAARNSAIAVLDIAVKNEALKLPAKQADKLDALVAAVEELTLDFYAKTNDLSFEEDKETVNDDTDWE